MQQSELKVDGNAIGGLLREIFALEGEFWACDLGSTNPTLLNGHPLLSKPEKLRDGDVLRIGEIELRYEEKPR